MKTHNRHLLWLVAVFHKSFQALVDSREATYFPLRVGIKVGCLARIRASRYDAFFAQAQRIDCAHYLARASKVIHATDVHRIL
jgi:diphthamide synthase (EF-2-diphthine--ammonia ligase)